MDLTLLNLGLQVASVILAPILIAYALLAYKGQYESRSLPGIITIAILLSASKIFGIWRDLNDGNGLVEVAQNLCVLAAIIVLFFLLRGYIHSEIDLRKNNKLKPRQEMKEKRK